MKDVLGSLPEVITAYKNYNLLVPTATDVQLNPFYKFHVEEVPVDLSENSGDIFKVGSVKTGKQDERGKDIWEDVFSLRSSLGGLSETEQTAAASTIFGKEAMSGMLAIINASEQDYNDLSNAIGNSKDAAQDMADTMLDNLAGSMTLMQSAVEGVQNSFGQRLTPYVRGFVDSITDAMPAVTVALNDFMDTVDKKAAHMKTVIGTMTASDEWQNADMFGKMDIAWDTLIGQPFADWIGGDGKHLISSGLGTLFSSASAILPGGKKAGLSSVLSSMLIAKGATGLLGNAKNIATTLQPIGNAIKSIGLAAQTAPSVGAFISDLGAMVPTAAKFGLAAAAVTAAVVGIGVAVDNYNQKAFLLVTSLSSQ